MKTILITGASRGIGKDIALKFANNGYAVVINYNKSEKKALDLFEQITKNGGTALICKADVNKIEEVKKMIEDIINAFGHIDVLVNNAGINSKCLLIDETENQTQNIIQTNLIAPINICKLVIPFMLKKQSGKIINISSVWGNCGASLEATYSASKAGIIALTKSLAKEYGYSGINVNCICPGLIETDMNKNLSEEEKKNIVSQIPSQRVGSVEDISSLVYFLCDSASYINGQVITVDGGFTL